MDLKGFFERNSLEHAKRIFAGFSGGPDSTSLLLLLDEESRRRGFQLKAIHFEHGLRGSESVEDAGWCRKFCEFRNIDFMEISLNVNVSRHPGESTEAAARRLRLKEWNVIAAAPGSFVALGHNSNDKVENVFLRLLRGSNCSGLTSLREEQKLGKITVIRPILRFKRSQIEDFLRLRGVSGWRIDSSNSEEDYRRNFFRNRIIPLISERFPNAGAAVLKSVYALEKDAEFIESVTCGIFKEVKGRKSIDIAQLKAMHPAILVRFLRLWLSEQTGSDYIPDSDFIARFTTEMNKAFEKRSTDRNASLVPLDGNGLFLKFGSESISIVKNKSVPELPASAWNWKKDAEIKWHGTTLSSEIIPAGRGPSFVRGEDKVYFDADALPEELSISQWRTGDVMIPFGKTSAVHLKKLFEAKKLDSAAKGSTPVVRTPSGEIIWIPGVRRANFANIGPAAKRIAFFSIVREL